MLIEVKRLRDNEKSTVGTISIDGVFECFTLEDTIREEKIRGETAIPVGEYEVTLRKEGGMTKRYAKKFKFHDGMIWLRGVPNFEWVYIHVGNDEDDTDGCLLVGKSCNASSNGQTISSSVSAYKDLYPKIADAIRSQEQVILKIT